MTRVCMGGTFDVLHRGHRALLDAAFVAGDEGVAIGVTTDDFANAQRDRRVRPYAERVERLQAFLASRDYASRAQVRPISDGFGFSLEDAFDAIAVTPETEGAAPRINAERAKLGLAPLAVVVSPYVLADDGRPIKATRVARGEIDAEGRLMRAPRVAVGSENPVKVEAVRRVLARIYGREPEVRAFAVASGVPEQPFMEDTWRGARERATAALSRWADADFGIGIEAGLLLGPDSARFFDVQACVVTDAGGRLTHGQGPGFVYPHAVEEELRAGGTVGDVLSRISGIDDIGRKGGAIGWLSRDLADRTSLTEPAVFMAFLPRLRPDAYGL